MKRITKDYVCSCRIRGWTWGSWTNWQTNPFLSETVASPDVELPYFQVAKAMSAYRLGHFAEAIEWAEKTIKSPIVYPSAHAYAVLAMAHWQLGQKDVARIMLAKGNALTPKVLPSHEVVDLGDSWVAWLEARISLDEAEALMESDASGAANHSGQMVGQPASAQ